MLQIYCNKNVDIKFN